MELAKKRMAIGVASTQSVETDALMYEVNFAAHQSMHPTAIDREDFAEQMDAAVIVGPADKDHRTLEWGAEVEREAPRKASPVGRGFSPGSGFAAIGRNVALGNGRQARDIGKVVALPDLALPKSVEAFDRVLEARLARRGKHGDDLEGQTQPADAPDRVGKLMRPLEDGIVVELRVAGQGRRGASARAAL